MSDIITQKNEGIVLVDKPVGISSYDVIRRIKKNYPRGTKIGHTGTLDPFASGLIILLIGRENTKKLDEFHKLTKTYVVSAKFGEETDTLDNTGKVVNRNDLRLSKENIIGEIEKSFLGKINQIPPKFSAVHINGKRAYQLSRQGFEFEIRPKEITVYSFKLIKYSWPYVDFEVVCSSGTYVRSLISDLAKNLNTFAFCDSLRRTKIGEFDVLKSVKL